MMEAVNDGSTKNLMEELWDTLQESSQTDSGRSRDKLNDNCCMLKNKRLRSNKGVDSRRESWREPMRESKGDSRREST